MNTSELVQYIKTELERGASREEIVRSLSTAGWNQEQINDAFQEAGVGVTSPPTTLAVEKKRKSPKIWVVILIILGVLGVLFFVVLPAIVSVSTINVARDYAKDAALRQTLRTKTAGLRPVAQRYSDENNDSFLGVCNSSVFEETLSEIETETSVVCFDSVETWAASAELGGSFFCVDSTGSAVDSYTQLAVGETACEE